MIKNNSNKKLIQDKIANYTLAFFAILSASIVFFIIIFISFKGISPFFKTYLIENEEYKVSIVKFIFNTIWFKPPNLFGVGFIVINTIYVVTIALILAVPTAVLTALFITKIASKRVSKVLTSVIELLSAIPSIIYGVFGAGIITLLVKKIADVFNIQTAAGVSSLSASIVLAIMILPTITILSITSINAVDPQLEENSLALGATKMETNFKLVLVAAKSGIFSAIILGLGRALGEATAVSLVAGNTNDGPTFNVLNPTRILTSTILKGFHEEVGLNKDIRFSVALVLIIVLLLSNYLLNQVKKRIGNLS